MSAVHADNCCTCGKCPIDGILVASGLTFSDLNAKPDGTDFTQYTSLGNLTGHYVIAYSGQGSFQATESSQTKWFSVWDFWISVQAPGTTLPTFDGVEYNRGAPDGGHAQVPSFAGGPGFGGYNIDPFNSSPTGVGGAQDWVSLLASSSGAYPVDASTTSAGAQVKCLAMEFAANATNTWFMYYRSSAYTLVNGSPTPSFNLYRLKANFGIYGCALIYGGPLDPHMHLTGFYQSNDHAWVYWVDISIVSTETASLQRIDRSTGNFFINFTSPNTGPTAAFPATEHLQVLDSFTAEVSADGTFTIAVIPVAVSVELLQKNSPGNWQVELDFQNLGNAPITSGSITLTAPGMTSVTISQGSPFTIEAAFPAPFSNSPFDLNSVIFTAQFANVNNTVTATITEGPRTFTVPFTVNGTT